MTNEGRISGPRSLQPAASVGVFSLSLTQKDGAFALLGYLLTLVSVGLLVLSAGAVWAAVEQLTKFFGG